jgi:hypothetical protein
MRKLIIAAMIAAALTVFAGGTSRAWADCSCGKTKCGSQSSECGCQSKCGCAKAKCSPCKNKCGCNTPKCGGDCKSKCGCEKPKCGCSTPKCNSCCAPTVPQNHHPYECSFRGSGILCDQGCCSGPICIPKCDVCTTTCVKKECKDGCGCTKVSWESCTTCGPPVRPVTIPWWFNIEAGSGNIYPGDSKMEGGTEEAATPATTESSEG